MVNHHASMDAVKVYPYCFVRSVSEVYLGLTEQAQYSPEEEILEARFFDCEKELRLFRDENGNLQTVELCKEDGDRFMDETYVIDNARFGKTLTVRQFLDADEDGQTFVKASCLCGWEGGTA